MARPLPHALPRKSAINLALVLCRVRRLTGVGNAEIARVLGAPPKALASIDNGHNPDETIAYGLLQLLHHVGGDTSGLAAKVMSIR